MGIDRTHPAYGRKKEQGKQYRRKMRAAASTEYTTCMERTAGLYAHIDEQGKLVYPLFIVTHPELCRACRRGIIKSGALLEQADLRGRHIGFFRLKIVYGSPLFKREQICIGGQNERKQ